MRTRTAVFFALAMMMAGLAGIGSTPVSAAVSGAVDDDPACLTAELPRNDDSSSEAVPIGFPVDFFGTTFEQLHVNNNGNVTFDSALAEFTPFPLLATDRVIIAPFFADVDTRPEGSGTVSYGQTMLGGRSAFCVNWTDVGYFSMHLDKTNSFQLFLVDRSDVAPGDFDIIFNYDRIEWEAGDFSGGTDGLGGSTARVGYASAGFDSFEQEGSDVDGALLDGDPDTGLIHNSRNTTQPGRYIFNVRNGVAVGAAVAGTVRDTGSGDPIPGSVVDLCTSAGACAWTRTGPDGRFRIEPVPPGDHRIRAWAPAGTDYETTVDEVTVAGADVDVDLLLRLPAPPPPGTSIEPSRSGGSVPVVYFDEPLQLTTTACPGGVASYSITAAGATVASGSMTEGPAGTYTAPVPALSPAIGSAEVAITVICPDGSEDTIRFDIYIDPSGTVLDTDGDPIADATVTLFRSDLPEGPFEAVEEGSVAMSPANRTNPMTTGDDGRFGWDTIPGFYVVRAEAEDCVDPDDPTTALVETPALPVPPPQLGLELVLDCGTVEPPPPPPAVDILLLSGDHAGEVGGVAYRDEDIVAHDPVSGTYALWFDGSDVGLTRGLDGMVALDDGSLLLSFVQPLFVSGIGRIDDSDVIRFRPSSLGEDTSGTIELFLDGSDVGLFTDTEDIDALALTPDGRLVVSTFGNVLVPGLRARPHDLIVLDDPVYGPDSGGTWSMYLDGSGELLQTSTERLRGASIHRDSGAVALTTRGPVSVPGAQGTGDDILECVPGITSPGPADCEFSVLFEAMMARYVDAIHVGPPAAADAIS